ncbi:unnamed protein product [Chironomus riparius]|uniref:C2H2-type domain-containing protein n=1 Tax=Chironomus riparius TaxID=315576 RepID=A0A9N9S804_9DIPT|nr:unnamed protein product [Chironomus riparius]
MESRISESNELLNDDSENIHEAVATASSEHQPLAAQNTTNLLHAFHLFDALTSYSQLHQYYYRPYSFLIPPTSPTWSPNASIYHQQMYNFGYPYYQHGSRLDQNTLNSSNITEMTEASQQKEIICKYCNRVFTTAYNLKVHKRIHTNERPFVCIICDKSFSRSDHLKHHKCIDNDLKTFKCSYCDREFSHQRSLAIHKVIHFKQAPYKCSICDSTFPQRLHLKKHMRIHKISKNKQREQSSDVQILNSSSSDECGPKQSDNKMNKKSCGFTIDEIMKH